MENKGDLSSDQAGVGYRLVVCFTLPRNMTPTDKQAERHMGRNHHEHTHHEHRAGRSSRNWFTREKHMSRSESSEMRMENRAGEKSKERLFARRIMTD